MKVQDLSQETSEARAPRSHAGSPAELRGGSWGARAEDTEALRAGDTITVTTKGGETWNDAIAEVLDHRRRLVFLRDGKPASTPKPRRRRSRCPNCGEGLGNVERMDSLGNPGLVCDPCAGLPRARLVFV